MPDSEHCSAIEFGANFINHGLARGFVRGIESDLDEFMVGNAGVDLIQNGLRQT